MSYIPTVHRPVAAPGTGPRVDYGFARGFPRSSPVAPWAFFTRFGTGLALFRVARYRAHPEDRLERRKFSGEVRGMLLGQLRQFRPRGVLVVLGLFLPGVVALGAYI